MIELVGSELVKRAAERAKRREDRERAAREGREPGEEDKEVAHPSAETDPTFFQIICSLGCYKFAGNYTY